MPKYNVSIDRQLRCRLCFDIEVEADSEDEAWEKAYDSEDEAWEKAYDTVDLGDLEVRDCEYSDDEITLLEE
jgi:hypothetical protein